MTREEVLAKIKPGKYVTLSCSGDSRSGDGYAGEIFDDHFHFDVVTNKKEHFGNESADARTVRYVVYFKDVDEITFEPWA